MKFGPVLPFRFFGFHYYIRGEGIFEGDQTNWGAPWERGMKGEWGIGGPPKVKGRGWERMIVQSGRVDNKCKQRHGETGKGPREGPYHVRMIFMLRTVRMWGGQNDPKGTGAGATSSVNAELRFPFYQSYLINLTTSNYDRQVSNCFYDSPN